MTTTDKPGVDFQKGMKWREDTATYLTTLLPLGYRIARIHTYLRLIPPSKRATYNKAMNRLKAAPLKTAMGLDYAITHQQEKRGTPLIFRSLTDMYLKTPGDFTVDWKEYLEVLNKFRYHVLFVDYEKKLYSPPIHIETLIKYWKPMLKSSKSNKNRLQFYGPMSKISVVDPTQPDLYGETIIDKLITILQ